MAFGTIYVESAVGRDMIEPANSPFIERNYKDNAELCNRRGTDDHMKYRGRGFMQLTGRCGYTYYSQEFGYDLLNTPDLAADRQIALDIMMHGMINGTFTVFYALPDPQENEITVSANGINTLQSFEIGGGGNYDWSGARDIISESALERELAAEQARLRFSPKLLEACRDGLLAAGINCEG